MQGALFYLCIGVQGKACRMASIRDFKDDLPREILCMRWTLGNQWVVLEANLKSKQFRIIFTEPVDEDIHVWNVSTTFSSMAKNQSAV
jgi:hypothetical protein